MKAETKTKENWFKRNEYIPTWLTAAGIIVGIYLLSNPYTIITDSGCPINYSIYYNTILKNNCNELSTGESKYLPQDIVSQFISSPKNLHVEVKMSRESPGVCRIYSSCVYTQLSRENIVFTDSVRVCITRNETNETTCY